MAREKIKLTVENKRGKIRYRKMYKGNLFVSPVYSSDNRENFSEARSLFVEWRRQFATLQDRKQAVRSAAVAVAGDRLAGMIEADRKQAQQQKDLNTVAVLNGSQSLEESEAAIARYARKQGSGSHLQPLAAKFLKAQLRRTKIDKANSRSLTPTAYKNKERYLKAVVDCLGNPHIDEIEETEVTAVFNCIDDKPLAEISKRDYMASFREFVNWACEERLKQRIPSNLMSRKLTFTPTKKTVCPPSVKESFQVIEALQDKGQDLLELCVLLHLNCGCYSEDIADLTQDDVDFDALTLTYLRGKATRHGFSPVTYPLWSRTATLLEELRSDDSVMLLTNAKGGHLGKGQGGKRKDNIGKRFTRNKKAHFADFSHSLMDFRKTAETELEEIGYADLGNQFLQHGRRDTTGQWYSGQFRQRFTEGVLALEKVFYP